jgi:hypothetical protein
MLDLVNYIMETVLFNFGALKDVLYANLPFRQLAQLINQRLNLPVCSEGFQRSAYRMRWQLLQKLRESSDRACWTRLVGNVTLQAWQTPPLRRATA